MIMGSFHAMSREEGLWGGSSTFFQLDSSRQLAKNLYLSTSRNPICQFKELIMTWMLETLLSKKRILKLYLKGTSKNS